MLKLITRIYRLIKRFFLKISPIALYRLFFPRKGIGDDEDGAYKHLRVNMSIHQVHIDTKVALKVISSFEKKPVYKILDEIVANAAPYYTSKIPPKTLSRRVHKEMKKAIESADKQVKADHIRYHRRYHRQRYTGGEKEIRELEALLRKYWHLKPK